MSRDIEPVCSRPDEERQVHRECFAWMERVCEDHGLTFGQRVVNVRVMLHFDRYGGRCDPSIIGLAERLGMSENTVRSALHAAKARGHLGYPENKGGKGHRHQFEFLVTPNQTGGLAKPPSTVEGSGTKTSTQNANPQANGSKPPNLASPNPSICEPKPPTTLGGNSINSKENSFKNSNVPLPSVADTLPCQRTGSLDEEGRKEARGLPRGASLKPVPHLSASKRG
jgi:hypothetical protein